MATGPRVTIVIVTYRSRGTIDQALEPLAPCLDDEFARCIVVDNASDDGTADFVESNYPNVVVVRSPGNIGFGRGCNLGIASANTPYVMLLNPDASIEPDSLRRLVEFMDRNDNAGIAGPATYDTTAGEFQHIGLLLTPMSLIRSALRMAGSYPQKRIHRLGDRTHLTNWVCGSSMMLRTSMLQSIGGFDPRFFLYFEETDLCIRALRNNYEIWAVGDCIARHIGAASARESDGELTAKQAGSIVEYFYPSRLYYLSKNFGWPAAFAAESVSGCVEWARWIMKKLLGRQPEKEELQVGRPFLRLPAKRD